MTGSQKSESSRKKMKNKKPDIIVWDEEKGYFAKSLPYASDLGAPVIKQEDVIGWRNREIAEVNHQFETKYNELREEFRYLISQYEINQFIYSKVEYNFVPVIGHRYHLYERDNQTFFLSLIEPSNWNFKYLYSVKLDSSNKWIRIP